MEQHRLGSLTRKVISIMSTSVLSLKHREIENEHEIRQQIFTLKSSIFIKFPKEWKHLVSVYVSDITKQRGEREKFFKDLMDIL